MKHNLAIIILNWNGAELTLDCLRSLSGVQSESVHILVVDNGSVDHSVGRIQAVFPEVQILALENNLGYSAGNNAGFQKARELWSPDYCLFLNNDTEVDPNFLTPLVTQLRSRDKIIVAPKIYYYDDKEKIWFAGGRINLWLGTIWHEGIRQTDREQFHQIKTIEYATGCCFAIRSRDFESLAGFDTSYAMYAEDVDLSLRFRRQGGRILFVPEAKIWHKVSASVGGAVSRQKILRKLKGHFRFLWLHARWYQWPTIILYLPVQLVISTIKYFMLR